MPGRTWDYTELASKPILLKSSDSVVKSLPVFAFHRGKTSSLRVEGSVGHKTKSTRPVGKLSQRPNQINHRCHFNEWRKQQHCIGRLIITNTGTSMAYSAGVRLCIFGPSGPEMELDLVLSPA